MGRHRYLRLWTYCTLTEQYVPPADAEDPAYPDAGYWELFHDVQRLIQSGAYAQIVGAPP